MTEPLTSRRGRRPVTGFLARGETGRPLLVCIPGGSYNARYFDVPGHSFVRAATERGFSVAALNRPGYEDSTPLACPTFAGNADALIAAIDDLWSNTKDGCHRGGAGRSLDWRGDRYAYRQPAAALAAARHRDLRHPLRRSRSRDPGLELHASRHLHRVHRRAARPVHVRTDQRPMTSRWSPPHGRVVADSGRRTAGSRRRLDPRLPDRCRFDRCSVHYGLSEHEQLWISSPAGVDAFAASFTGAPSVSAHHVPGVGHNIDHHHAGSQYRETYWTGPRLCPYERTTADIQKSKGHRDDPLTQSQLELLERPRDAGTVVLSGRETPALASCSRMMSSARGWPSAMAPTRSACSW